MTSELSGCQRLPKLAGKFASCAFFSVKIFLHLETGRRKLKKKRERERIIVVPRKNLSLGTRQKEEQICSLQKHEGRTDH